MTDIVGTIEIDGDVWTVRYNGLPQVVSGPGDRSTPPVVLAPDLFVNRDDREVIISGGDAAFVLGSMLEAVRRITAGRPAPAVPFPVPAPAGASRPPVPPPPAADPDRRVEVYYNGARVRLNYPLTLDHPWSLMRAR